MVNIHFENLCLICVIYHVIIHARLSKCLSERMLLFNSDLSVFAACLFRYNILSLVYFLYLLLLPWFLCPNKHTIRGKATCVCMEASLFVLSNQPFFHPGPWFDVIQEDISLGRNIQAAAWQTGLKNPAKTAAVLHHFNTADRRTGYFVKGHTDDFHICCLWGTLILVPSTATTHLCSSTWWLQVAITSNKKWLTVFWFSLTLNVRCLC